MNRLWTICSITALMVMATGRTGSAQSINITGTVVDSATSQAVSGATVYLAEYPQFTTTTSSTGSFTLTANATNAHRIQPKFIANKIELQGNTLAVIPVNSGEVVRVDVFNALGIKVFHSINQSKTGDAIRFSNLWQSPGFYCIKVQIGTVEKTLISSGDRYSRSPADQTSEKCLLAKNSAAYTLQVEKTGYSTRQISITSLTVNVGTVKLNKTPLFFDDFTGSTVDQTKWSVLNRVSDLVNGELNCVTPNNVSVSGGIFSITAKVEDHTCGDPQNAPALKHYTSGQIMQAPGIPCFLYGTVEARLKNPSGDGVWPCFWMLSQAWKAGQVDGANNSPFDGSANFCEIDIAEFMQGQRSQVNVTAHIPNFDSGTYGASLPYNSTTRFMVYRVRWSAASLIFEVDPEDGTGWHVLRTITDTNYIPHVPMYVIFNMAVGGIGGGTPNPAAFPMTMSVDWVKVTQ